MWDTVMDAGTRSPEEAAAPPKNKAVTYAEYMRRVKNSSLTAFHKASKMPPNSTP